MSYGDVTQDVLEIFVEAQRGQGLEYWFGLENQSTLFAEQNKQAALEKQAQRRLSKPSSRRYRTHRVALGGRMVSGRELALRHGVPTWLVYRRVQYGWDLLRAATTPHVKGVAK